MNIVAVAACIFGIAHTYIAKEKLIRVVEGMEHTTHVETQGTTGTEDELTAEQIKAADAVILVIDIAITGTECFEGKKIVRVPTNVCVKAPKQLTQKIEAELNEQRKRGKRIMKKLGTKLERHAPAAISYILPLVVASGLLVAIENLMGGEVVTDSSKVTIPSALTLLGISGMGLPPSFIAGYTSYSIADRPGITPGLLMGQTAPFLGTGSLGGMVGGYIVGHIALFIRKHLKVSHWAEASILMMIIPTLSSIIAGLLMYLVIGTPIVRLTEGPTNFITGLDQSSKVLYGFIIGALGCLDFGGPVSKVPNLICDGLLLGGILEPEAVKVLAATIPPLGITLSLIVSKFIKKRIYTSTEVGNIRVASPMGLCMISEGVIPIAMNDPTRTVICTSIGCGATGAISLTLGAGSTVPSGGTFVIPVMTNPFAALLTLLAGMCVIAALLVLIKKKRTDADEVQVEEAEEEMDLSGITFS